MDSLTGLKELIIEYVEQLDEENVIKIANKALDEGIEPLSLLEMINDGMKRVGKLYEQKHYYIADLIMSGIIFKQVLELDKMGNHFRNNESKYIGKVLLGTVKGDIHDIGKDIFKGILQVNGFEVIDIGVDAEVEVFVREAIKHKPHILAMSGPLTNTIDPMRDVVDAFVKAGIRDDVKIIVGSSHINKNTCEYIGADGFANDAYIGTNICLNWINDTNRQGAGDNDNSNIY
jgi:methanogenic corrinoid protein MtbC1